MALFTKKTWKNRMSEYPTRRRLTKENGTTELVTVARSEGTVSQEGDAFSADNMNNLEDRILRAIGTGDIPKGLGADIVSAINALNTGIANLSGKSSTFLTWQGVTIGIYRYGRMGSIATISGNLTAGLTAYTKYTICTITSDFRPLNQLTKVILIQGDVQAMLNITREGVVELTPYAALAKGYVPLISEMYEIS